MTAGITNHQQEGDRDPGGPTFPLLSAAVDDSITIWARDLKGLFEHARERFGDVCWHGQEESAPYAVPGEPRTDNDLWGHKGEQLMSRVLAIMLIGN
jgi:hypothetical protein